MKKLLICLMVFSNYAYSSTNAMPMVLDFQKVFRFNTRNNPNIRTLNTLLAAQAKKLNQTWSNLPQRKSYKELNQQLKPIFNEMLSEVKSRAQKSENEFYLREVYTRSFFYDAYKLLSFGIKQQFIVDTLERLAD